MNKDPEVGPKILPIAPLDEITDDCRLIELQLTNFGNDAVDVFVRDGQDPPVPLIRSQGMQPGATISMNSQAGRLMPGGVTWWASARTVSGWMKATYI